MIRSGFPVSPYMHTFEIYSVTNSTGATQRFSTNHKTSSEQKNRNSFISDQSQMWDVREKFISINEKTTKYLLKGATKNVGWSRLSSLHCNSYLNSLALSVCTVSHGPSFFPLYMAYMLYVWAINQTDVI